MEAWEKTFREYIVPQFTRDTLVKLRVALLRDDDTIMQRAICLTKSGDADDESLAERTCPLAYMVKCEDGLSLQRDVMEAFSAVEAAVCSRSGFGAAFWSFVSFVDETRMATVKTELIRVLNDLLDNTPTEVISNG